MNRNYFLFDTLSSNIVSYSGGVNMSRSAERLFPHSRYSVFRTCKEGTAVVAWEETVRRLTDVPCEGQLDEKVASVCFYYALCDPCEFSIIGECHQRTVGGIIQNLLEILPKQDYRITYIRHCDRFAVVLQPFVLPPLPEFLPDAKLLVGAVRNDGLDKTTDWTRKRAEWRDVMNFEGMEDGLMASQINDELCLTEGLSTSIFVLTKDGNLMTAPSPPVLPGSVRAAVLFLRPQTILHAPRVSMAWNWQAVAVGSTSRLIIPLARIDGIEAYQPTLDGTGAMIRLRDEVQAYLEATATLVPSLRLFQ